MKPIPGAAPATLPELVRAQDRISFLYVDRALVNRQDNAITVVAKRGTAHVPATAIASLLLGPGTSISHQAMVLLADSGTTVAWVGEGGIRLYAHGRGLASSTRLLEQQARLVTNQRSRLAVARDMYGMRFPEEDVSSLSMSQLRGREGVRVQRLYRDHARRTGVEWDRRGYAAGAWDSANAVNQALSAANACLYGAAHSVINALGCSAGLGFVHTGNQKSFVYDIADLYKAETSIPTAFEIAAAAHADPTIDPGGAARRATRDRIFEAKLMNRCVDDIRSLLGLSDEPSERAAIFLWDDKSEAVSGGVVYRDPSMDETTAFADWESTWSS